MNEERGTINLCIQCIEDQDDFVGMNVSTCSECGNIGLVMEVENG